MKSAESAMLTRKGAVQQINFWRKECPCEVELAEASLGFESKDGFGMEKGAMAASEL